MNAGFQIFMGKSAGPLVIAMLPKCTAMSSPAASAVKNSIEAVGDILVSVAGLSYG
nr:hypothetical protein [Clavibacter michiganensis]